MGSGLDPDLVFQPVNDHKLEKHVTEINIIIFASKERILVLMSNKICLSFYESVYDF